MEASWPTFRLVIELCHARSAGRRASCVIHERFVAPGSGDRSTALAGSPSNILGMFGEVQCAVQDTCGEVSQRVLAYYGCPNVDDVTCNAYDGSSIFVVTLLLFLSVVTGAKASNSTGFSGSAYCLCYDGALKVAVSARTCRQLHCLNVDGRQAPFVFLILSLFTLLILHSSLFSI